MLALLRPVVLVGVGLADKLLDWIAGPQEPYYRSKTVPPRHPMRDVHHAVHHGEGCTCRSPR